MSDNIGKVQVGDMELNVTRFRGLKAMLAGALVARVMTEIPDINKGVGEFRKKYREDNKLVVTKAMAKTPQFQYLQLEDSDFSGGPVELPLEPSQQEILAEVFPPVWNLAREELTRFLALIAIDNGELERADDADSIEASLDTLGKQIMRKGTVGEILELCVVGQEVLRDEIISKNARLGKLMDQIPFLRELLSTPEKETTTEETPEMSTDESQTLSTTSVESTDGTDESLSTESPGQSSSSSLPLISSDEPQKDEQLKNKMEDTPENPPGLVTQDPSHVA